MPITVAAPTTIQFHAALSYQGTSPTVAGQILSDATAGLTNMTALRLS
jgi:hypothetical protein